MLKSSKYVVWNSAYKTDLYLGKCDIRNGQNFLFKTSAFKNGN